MVFRVADHLGTRYDEGCGPIRSPCRLGVVPKQAPRLPTQLPFVSALHRAKEPHAQRRRQGVPMTGGGVIPVLADATKQVEVR